MLKNAGKIIQWFKDQLIRQTCDVLKSNNSMKTLNERVLDLFFTCLTGLWLTIGIGLGVSVVMRLNTVLKVVSEAGKQYAQQ